MECTLTDDLSLRIVGIRTYERKLKESRMPGGRKLHRNAGESSGIRCRKKLLGKSEWFKSRKKSEEQEEQSSEQSGTRCRPRQNVQKKLQGGVIQAGTGLKTRTVLFLEQTKGGGLGKVIREVLARIEHILGYKVKVAERSGTSIRNALPNTNPWAGSHCSREDCITCNQGAEEIPDCKKRSLVYENICLECNPGAAKMGELKVPNMEVPSIYVGETARSVKERAKEHWEDFKSEKPDSHILKHWAMHHNSVGQPKFIMKVVQYHRSALSRQVGEAIRIQRRGGVTLNSRG